MTFLKKLRWVLYPLYFFFMFFVVLYLTFPADALKGYIAQQIENSLAAEGQGQWVHPPRVHIGHLSLWRLSGLGMDDVSIQLGSQAEETAHPWHFDELKFRLGIFSSLFGRPKVEFDSNLYKGSVRGSVTLTKAGGISHFWFDVAKVDLVQLSGSEKSELPLAGQMNIDAEFDLGKNPSLDGDGELNFGFKGLAVGPGTLELPIPGMMGGIPVPKINFGEFSGKISLKKGKGKTQDLRLAGGDIEANLNLDVDVNKNLMRSKLDGSGWFRIAPKFLEANPAFKSILEFNREIKNAREPDGRYSFVLKGTLDRPFPRFGKEKRSSQSDKVPYPLKKLQKNGEEQS